ncbi:MAG: EF-P lysine aminoacylase GenX [Methylococcales symbiont of Hymedesmia sp. n. MRB-2018]|nr:MAG: EF-P lysine aminoacylase GenX [Methylococcales symbiont of Hymedesmia sp. n. MRB-2018]
MNGQWAPACNLKQLQCRAQMLSKIRAFFEQRKVLEVETPLLCHSTGTDPQLDFFSSAYHCSPNNKQMYLQTSPEFAMKRLLAAGSGSIYQICKAFRNGESGRFHNPEFSILEWYRIDYNLQQLMDETIELLLYVLEKNESTANIKVLTYSALFEEITALNPCNFCLQSYISYAENNNLTDAISLCENDHSMWLDFIFSHIIQPELEQYHLCIVYGYPAIQASLSRINIDNPAIADRFEVFIKGIEIANGFLELADRNEQERRFDQENEVRRSKGMMLVKKDPYFLDALSAGLPECSGIALGLDRLLMILTNSNSLKEVMPFPFDRA